jgi:GNAT superfamily N-acetyltransferase
VKDPTIRWSGEKDTAVAMNAVHWLGFMDGHAYIFSEQEFGVVNANAVGEGWDFTWRELLPGNQLTAVAVDEDGIVAALTLWRPPKRSEYSIVEPMNVLRDYRRKGIGTRLWKYVERHSQERGDRGLRVWAISRNTDAIAFYRDSLKLREAGLGEFRIGDHREPAIEFRQEFSITPSIASI